MGLKQRILVNDEVFEVEVLRINRNSARFVVEERAYEVQFEKTVPIINASNKVLLKKQRTLESKAIKELENSLTAKPTSSTFEIKETSLEIIKIFAPICGVILDILVSPDQFVQQGVTLLRLEAMKMENNIFSPFSGKILKVFFKAGDEVKDGEVLLELEKDGG